MNFWLVSDGGMDEAAMRARPYWPMPEYNIDDFSSTLSEAAVRALLLAHDEDLPPETLAIRASLITRFVQHMRSGDMLCVVHEIDGEFSHVSFAEINSEAYGEKLASGAIDNRLPLRWLEHKGRGYRLFAYKTDLHHAKRWPELVEDTKFQRVLKSFLPLPGQSWIYWQWLVGLLLILQAWMMLKGMF